MRARYLPPLVVAALLFGPELVFAHGMRTGSLRIEEVAPNRALARWTTTVVGPRTGTTVQWPSGCRVEPVDGSPVDTEVAFLTCPEGLTGQTVGVEGLGPVVTEATVVVKFLDGHAVSRLLTRDEDQWILPREQSALDTARSYVRSGVVHIATGPDHLLFLVLLVLLLRRTRDVLLAETAFTISHSVSFSATALGLVHFPVAPTEACIALSLVLLALDVRATPTAYPRRGILAAFVFGLVHGLGFAGGLHQAGLPDQHAAVALVGFGAGVEIGQLVFLAVVMSALALASRVRNIDRLVPVSAVAVGGLAMSWFFERTSALL
jgi:hydrogenase/urease accessory protein HupE